MAIQNFATTAGLKVACDWHGTNTADTDPAKIGMAQAYHAARVADALEAVLAKLGTGLELAAVNPVLVAGASK